MSDVGGGSVLVEGPGFVTLWKMSPRLSEYEGAPAMFHYIFVLSWSYLKIKMFLRERAAWAGKAT